MNKIVSVLMVCSVLLCAGVSFADTSTESIAQQDQAQNQGQAQNQIASGNVAFSNSFNGSAPIRYLPSASSVNYSGLKPQMFARPDVDKGENFISANSLITLMGAWNVDAMSDEDLDEDDIQIDITTVGVLDENERLMADDIVEVTFMIQGSAEEKALKTAGTKALAIGTIKCDTDDINSAELFMVLAKIAREFGATNVILIGEGVKLELESDGWGIGLSYNYAGVTSASTGYGQVGAGGTGISGGSASYHKMPYLMFAFKK
ncbi:MAG: hypothetical protein DRQ78_12730 [Epsilonproteobacteria bacterium]|nr:MAG: hypothetical protein DRQ78_12730 [Campylobacterota bacterium]